MSLLRAREIHAFTLFTVVPYFSAMSFELQPRLFRRMASIRRASPLTVKAYDRTLSAFFAYLGGNPEQLGYIVGYGDYISGTTNTI